MSCSRGIWYWPCRRSNRNHAGSSFRRYDFANIPKYLAELELLHLRRTYSPEALNLCGKFRRLRDASVAISNSPIVLLVGKGLAMHFGLHIAVFGFRVSISGVFNV